MPLKTFTIDFKNIAFQENLRLDFGYRYFFDYKKGRVWNFSNTIELNKVLILLNSKKVKKGLLDDEEILLDIGNVERRSNNLINYEKVNEIESDKVVLKSGDVVIPKLQPQMGNIFLNLEHNKFLGSTEFLEYKISNEFNPYFLYYLLTSFDFLNSLAKLESGKTHRRVNPKDLLNINIPLIPKSTQDQIVAQIKPIEKEIKDLKSKTKNPKEIINKVFAREFGFDLEKFEQAKGEKFFDVSFEKIGKNDLLRFSVHFQHKKLNFIEFKLKEKDKWENLINKFKLEGGKRIPKGKNVSNEETGYYYLRPTEVSFWGIDKNNLLFLPRDLYEKLKRYRIKSGEFAISIVGTLGKTAFVDNKKLDIEEDNLILSENFIKLTPKVNLNNLFYYYFFYSFIFEAQTEREYTITSIKKLGIDKWSYIKIPNTPLSHQQRIVDEIQVELNKQEEIKKKIEKKRNKIDEIIERTVLN
jgi:type I restriction enzyme S subunit